MYHRRELRPGSNPLFIAAASGALGGGAAFTLPFTDNFDTDGALSAPWVGGTFAVSGGVVANAPTTGSNLLTDSGLEATYTSGKCNTLTKGGSPTLTEETTDVHGGSKAQKFQPTAFNNLVYWPTVAGSAGQWYEFSVYGKRTAGTGDSTTTWAYQAGQIAVNDGDTIDGANFEKCTHVFLSTTTNVIYPRGARHGSAGELTNVVIIDDGNLATLAESSLFALINSGQSDVVVKIKASAFTDGSPVGIVLRADSNTSPSNYILLQFAKYDGIPAGGKVSVIKKIGSTYTQVLAPTYVGTTNADYWLEIRASGNTVQVFYNDTQRGSDLTISDAELGGNYHGMFIAGQNTVTDFFVSAV